MRLKTVPAMLDKLWDSKWKEYLLPLCFTLTGISNFLLYYLGFAYMENPIREYGFIAAQLLFAVLCGLMFLASLRRSRLPGKTWILGGLAVLFFVFSFAEGLRRVGYNASWFEFFTHAVCFVLPAFLAGICCALSHSERAFLRHMEQLSLFLFPGALIYFNFSVFNVNPSTYARALGVIAYMSFANSIMPVLLAHVICFAKNADWEFPFIGKKTSRPQLLRACFILVYWVAVIGSGTRSTLLSVAVFCVVWSVSAIRQKDYFFRALCLSLAMCGLLVFNLTVYAPPGMSKTGATSRMQDFILNVVETGEINTLGKWRESEELLESLNEIVASSEVCPYETRNRMTLYKLAWKEFLKSPLTGMGLSGYAVKYEKYPHNAILEALAEMGALGALYLALVVYTFIRMCREAGRDVYVKETVLFLTAYAVLANFSGSVWMCDALAFGLGFGLTWQPLKSAVQKES